MIAAQKPTIHVMPFDYSKKRMTTVHSDKQGILVYTKGAPRSVLSICNKILVNGKTEDLTAQYQSIVEEKIREFANNSSVQSIAESLVVIIITDKCFD